jgi:hypothetical protein
MLKTSTDFEESVKYMIEDLPLAVADGITYQDTTMNSDDYNSSMKYIEDRFNKLYEKTRILEDIISYVKEYTKNAIYDNTKEIKSLLNEIEQDRDSTKKSLYTTYDIPFTESDGSYADRNAYSLKHCAINNGMLTLATNNKSIINYDSIQKTSSLTPYRNNLQDLKKDKPYRTYYLLDAPAEGGIKEDIRVDLNTPAMINYIDAVIVNSKESNVRFVLSNGAIEYNHSFTENIGKDRNVKNATFALSSSTYTTKKYKVDTNRWTEDFWTKVGEMEYNVAMGVNDSLYDIDVISGIKNYQEQYVKYILDMKKYEEEYAQYLKDIKK